MPGTPVHINQAQHKEEFFLSFDRTVYSDWAITVLFYAALHYVDAFLAHVGIRNPGGHSNREQYIQSRPELQPIYNEYSRLKNRSASARYYARRFSPEEIERCRNQDLENIKQRIRSILT